MEVSKIEGGCPCPSSGCDRHGNCPECINHHYKTGKSIVVCMRKIAENVYCDTCKEANCK